MNGKTIRYKKCFFIPKQDRQRRSARTAHFGAYRVLAGTVCLVRTRSFREALEERVRWIGVELDADPGRQLIRQFEELSAR